MKLSSWTEQNTFKSIFSTSLALFVPLFTGGAWELCTHGQGYLHSQLYLKASYHAELTT